VILLVVSVVVEATPLREGAVGATANATPCKGDHNNNQKNTNIIIIIRLVLLIVVSDLCELRLEGRGQWELQPTPPLEKVRGY